MKTETVVLIWASIALLAGGIAAAVLAGQVDCGVQPTVDCEAMKTAAWQFPAVALALGVGLGFAAIGVGYRPSSPEHDSAPPVP
jgi:F0F1-type ATP synthase membrane subunit c/vacuolar-type H+-ATPase subunit K